MPAPKDRKPPKRRLVPSGAVRDDAGERPRGGPGGRAPPRDGGHRRGPPPDRRGPPSGGYRGGPPGRGRGPSRDFDPVVETMPPQPLPALARRERRMHVLSDLPSDPRYGKRPADRSVEELLELGLVVLDKPRGPTSHQVVAWLRDILGVARVGHGGTLDPKVSGVLPTTLGDGTKAVGALLTAGKEYIAVLRLHGDADEETVRREARRFIGKVRQVPPVRSAVARRARIRRIYDLQVLEVNGRDVLFRVASEAGTYIRNLCIDLGKAVGTRGHMAELRRTRTGVLAENEAVSLYDVKDAVHLWKEDGDERLLRQIVHPVERVLAHLPRIRLRDSAVDAVCHGAELAAPGLAAVEEGIVAGDTVALFSGKDEAVALATARMSTEEMLKAKSGTAAELDRVLMKPGTYPATWRRHRTETRTV